MTHVALELGKSHRRCDVILTFQKENRFLSNFWPCQVALPAEFVDGQDMPEMPFESVENAYQAWKSNQLSQRQDIQKMTAAESKDLSLSEAISMRGDFTSDLKIQAMDMLIVEKFSDKNPDLKQKLLGTGEATLIEGNDWDDVFWGICLKTGRGENNLGRLLMKRRDHLQVD